MPLVLCSFKVLEGNVNRGNDARSLSSRKDAIREQLEERGENVDSDLSGIYGLAGGTLVFLVGGMQSVSTH